MTTYYTAPQAATSTRSRLDVALECVENGYSVFPCGIDKRPATSHGFKDATDRISQVRAWWGSNPSYLIGLRTGSGLAVLDFDTDTEKGLEAEKAQKAAETAFFQPFPETYTAQTRRGGWHRYYRLASESTVSIASAALGIPGFDVRGDGGYVIVHGDAAPPHVDDLAQLPCSMATRLSSPVRTSGAANFGGLDQFKDNVSLPKVLSELQRICLLIVQADHGAGHDTILKVARRVGGWVGAKQLSMEDAEKALMEAVNTRPDPDKHMATLQDGIMDGLNAPCKADDSELLTAWDKIPSKVRPAGGCICATDAEAEELHSNNKALLDLFWNGVGTTRGYADALLATEKVRDVGHLASMLMLRDLKLGKNPSSGNALSAAEAAIDARVARLAREKAQEKAQADKLAARASTAARAPISGLAMNTYGRPECTFANVVLALATRGDLWWNALKETAWIKDVDGTSKVIEKKVISMLRGWLALADLHPTPEMIRDAVLDVALRDTRHPILEYLGGLTWDGVKRLEHVAEKGFCGDQGAELNAWHSRLLTIWMLSAVARVCEPGCKVDTMLVAHGPQGVGKSSSIELLVGGSGWVNDNPISADEKRAIMEVPSFWVHEMGELATLRARDVEGIKQFLSKRTDSGVPMHGTVTLCIPRACVFWGTTNTIDFLMDHTGSRRFMCIQVEAVDRAWIAANRDQLWAEAVYRLSAGEKWQLEDDEEKTLAERNEACEIEDIVFEAVKEMVEMEKATTTTWRTVSILARWVERKELNRATATSVGRALRKLGLVSRKINGLKVWTYANTSVA